MNNPHSFQPPFEDTPNPKQKLAKFNTQILQLYQQGQVQEALNLSQQALIEFPNDTTLLPNAGIFATTIGDTTLAIKYFKRNITLNPDNASGYYFLAKAKALQEKFKEAINAYKKALRLDPNHIKARLELALILTKQKKYTEAKQHYYQTLKLQPNSADAHNSLASLLVNLEDFQTAEAHYRKALDIDANHPSAAPKLSLLLLQTGNWTQGWQYYESRYTTPHSEKEYVHMPNISTPMWQGEDLSGKSILVFPEQGFGDELQFIRYASLLKSQKKAAYVILVCRKPLKKLFSTMECFQYIIDEDEFKRANIQGLNYWVFNMSLPLHFNTTIDTIPNQLPYLHSPQAEQDNWKNKLPQGINIGLVWKGQAKHKNDKNRSLPSIKTLKPLWNLKNKSKHINFISLQKDAGEDEAKNPPSDQPLIHLGTDIQDFSDTAAIVSQLDLVICVDTAIAHLAGSLNIPCWVLLPSHDTDWRWGLNKDNTPWYPNTIHLFRQTINGDWDEVINKVIDNMRPLHK